MPGIDSTPKALGVIGLACTLLPFALLWMIFPVLLLLHIHRLSQAIEALVASREVEEEDEDELLAEFDSDEDDERSAGESPEKN